jgi:tetratricopeptide (TPR) repeat protein
LQLIHKLAISEAAAPQQLSCIADAASDLARAYRERGQLFLASVYFQQALASRETELGPDHPRTLSAMYNLALVYADQKMYSEAMEYFEVVHTKRSQTLSNLHPSVLAVDLKIASMHKSQGQVEQAMQIYNDVRHKYQAVLGENHPSTLAVICEIAGTYREQGRLEEAMASYQDILTCCGTASGIAQRRVEDAKIAIEDIKRELAKGDHQGESVEALYCVHHNVPSLGVLV